MFRNSLRIIQNTVLMVPVDQQSANKTFPPEQQRPGGPLDNFYACQKLHLKFIFPIVSIFL